VYDSTTTSPDPTNTFLRILIRVSPSRVSICKSWCRKERVVVYGMLWHTCTVTWLESQFVLDQDKTRNRQSTGVSCVTDVSLRRFRMISELCAYDTITSSRR